MKALFIITAFLICSQMSFGQKVKGKVIDNSYFPIPGVDIEIEGGGSSETDKNGEFSVDVKKIPYTITLISKEYSIAVRYESITELNPELKLFTNASNKYSNQEYIIVDFPKVPENSEGIMQFLSNDVCISRASVIRSGMSSTRLNVRWPLEKESIQGYIVYLEKSGDEYTKYFQYQTKIIKKPLLKQRVTIAQSFLSINPGTSIITINPTMYDLATPRYSVYANFSELGVNSFIEFPVNKATDGRIIANVPSTLPFDYRVKLQTDLSWKNGKGYTKFLYLKSNTMTLNSSKEDVPVILSPLGINIKYDTTTSFSYSKNFGYGVFVVSFYNTSSPFPAPNPANGTFHIVTTKQTVKHPLENSYGILNGNNYSWYVSNYWEFKDADDFVRPGRSKMDFGESKIARSERKNLEFIFN